MKMTMTVERGRRRVKRRSHQVRLPVTTNLLQTTVQTAMTAQLAAQVLLEERKRKRRTRRG
eukprot:5362172-Amphidinium_carterae.1